MSFLPNFMKAKDQGINYSIEERRIDMKSRRPRLNSIRNDSYPERNGVDDALLYWVTRRKC